MITKIQDKYYQEVDVEQFIKEASERVQDIKTNLLPIYTKQKEELEVKIGGLQEECDELEQQLEELNTNNENNN